MKKLVVISNVVDEEVFINEVVSDGRDTCIFASDDTDGVFCCSDSDRWTEFEIMD